MTEKAVARPPRKSAYFVLAIIVALLIGGWSAYWAFARGAVYDVIRNAQMVADARGGSIQCGNQSLGGYPFRFELLCSPFRMEQDGQWYFVERLQVVALAYNPTHVIIDAQSPAEINLQDEGRGPAYAAEWKTAQASVKAEGGRPAIVGAAFKDPTLTFADGSQVLQLDAVEAEAHVRRIGDEGKALDVAFLVNGLTSKQASGHLPIDLELVMQLPDGGKVLDGKVSDLSDLMVNEELRVSVSTLNIGSGEFKVNTRGDLVIDEDGRLNGTLPLVITGIHQLQEVLAPLFPQGSKTLESLQKTALAIGRGSAVDGVPTLNLPVTLENGRARIAFFDLGPVPRFKVKKSGS